MLPKRKGSALDEPKAKKTKPETTTKAALVSKRSATPVAAAKKTKTAAKPTAIKRLTPDGPEELEPKSKKIKSTDENWSTLSVAELKKELEARGLSKTGSKLDFVERLTKAPSGIKQSRKSAAEKKDWSKGSVLELKRELEERGLSTAGNKAELVARLGGTSGVKVAAEKATSKAQIKRKPRASTPKPIAPKFKFGPTINQAPAKKLDIYVFGEGSAGELGLGAYTYEGKKPLNVKRPRLNHLLKADTVGVVAIDAGGMHAAALTHDNKILTWGVNDNGALGREAQAGGKMVDLPEEGAEADDSDSDDDDSGLNPNEAEPREVDPKYFPEGTKFVGLLACDSATFALTQDGSVYGWGTFRGNDGVMGFRTDDEGKKQSTPILIPELKKIIALAGGTNHVLALDNKGKVFTFGAGEQNQMGRRTVARHARAALTPREFGLQRKKIVTVGCGDYNSFCVDKDGDVYAWGLNAFGQTGIDIDQGDVNDTIAVPTLVEKLKGYRVKQITGGAHHTLAVTEDGKALIWGSIQNAQGGIDFDDIDREALFRDQTGAPRYLKKPVVIPDITGESISSGPDHCLLITKDHEAYSWGFNENYQTGQGQSDKVMEATQIENSAVNGKKLVFVGAGGQFGIIAGEAI